MNAPLRVSPIDGETVLMTVEEASASAIDAAVEEAAALQARWRSTSPLERQHTLERMASGLEGASDEIAATMVLEVGKTPVEARGEIANAVRLLRFHAGSALRTQGSVYPSGRAQTRVFSSLEPHGVVGAITPWNFPVNLAITKVAPALAAGNAVVIKPSPYTAGTTRQLVEALTSDGDGSPPLVLLTGGGETGAALSEHPGVDFIAFTGSTAAGLAVAATAARRSRPFLCEMGGKNAVTLMPGANLDRAVPAIIEGAFRMAGQKCTATSRLIVHRSLIEQVRARLEGQLAGLVVGDPRGTDVFCGPVIDAASRARLLAAIESSDESVDVVAARPVQARPVGGYYVEPHVLFDAETSSPLAATELFGPVLVVQVVDSLAEAIDLTNATDYGLVAAVWTADVSEAMTFTSAVRTGTALVNQPTAGLDFNIPFAGWKSSGLGGAEQGDESVAVFSRTKMNYISW
jgi:acyl-CoA reductase-like NAD-dependent aldehyde dehydrogenase